MIQLNLFKLSQRIGNSLILCIAATMSVAPALAQGEESLRQDDAQEVCQYVVSELGNVPSSILEVASGEAFGDGLVVRPRVTETFALSENAFATDTLGTCIFDSSGILSEVDTLIFYAEGFVHFRDFGEVSEIGRFIVLLQERGERVVATNAYPTSFYYSTIGRDSHNENVIFPVLVDGQRELWWADCSENYVGRQSEDVLRELPIARSAFTRDVTRLACQT